MAEMVKIRTGSEWAHIFMDEATGTFSAVSSFGNFSYIWSAIGNDTLAEFLSSLDAGYFFGKTHHGCGVRYSFDETIKNLKHRIIEGRREGRLCKDMARDAWDDIEKLMQDTASNETEYWLRINTMDGIWHLFDSDSEMLMPSQIVDPQCEGFWETIWPAFLTEIKAAKAA